MIYILKRQTVIGPLLPHKDEKLISQPGCGYGSFNRANSHLKPQQNTLQKSMGMPPISAVYSAGDFSNRKICHVNVP